MHGEAEQLQDHLARMRAGEPWAPLEGGRAIAQAKRLRMRGLSYSAVAEVMAMYHDVAKNPSAWRHQLRAMGVPPKHYSHGRQRLVQKARP